MISITSNSIFYLIFFCTFKSLDSMNYWMKKVDYRTKEVNTSVLKYQDL